MDYRRPMQLCRYSKRVFLDSALQQGEFRLCPASDFKDTIGDIARQDEEMTRHYVVPPADLKAIHQRTGQRLDLIGPARIQMKSHTDYYVLCFSEQWSAGLFEEFKDTEACLIINDPDEFGERLHTAAGLVLRDWTGFDARVDYLKPHNLGVWFSKALRYAAQFEWRFIWIPPNDCPKLAPIFIRMGSIGRIAEIHYKKA